MNFMNTIKKVFKISETHDKAVSDIYKESIQQLDEANKTAKHLNRMLTKPDATYRIGKAIGAIKT